MNQSNRTPLIDALLPQPRPMALEQRFMFDAAAVTAVTDPQYAPEVVQSDSTANDSDLARFAEPATVTSPVTVRPLDGGLNNGSKEVAFIDTGVADYQTLVDGVRAGVEVVLLDAGQNGLAQMALWAQSHSGYDAIHVLSHGSNSSIQLGQFQLSNVNMSNSEVSSELKSLGQALTDNGDLLIYGCNVAQDAYGQAFINTLASLTGADVAASVDGTGSENLGGNWVLEATFGQISQSGVFYGNYNWLLADTTFNGTLTSGGTSIYRPWTPLDIDYTSNGGSTTLDTSTVYAANQITQTSPSTYNYTVATFTPSVTGLYTITVTAASFTGYPAGQNWAVDDSWVAVYSGSFNAANTLDNLLYANDDSVNNSDYKSKIPNINLTAGNNYVFLMTTFFSGMTGTYTYSVNGPSTGTFTAGLPASGPSAPAAPDMTSATDTGTSQTDNITYNTTPTFTIGSVSGGNTVKLFNDANNNGTLDSGELLASGVATGSSIDLTPTSAMGSGTYNYIKALQVDGSSASSTSSSAISITIDTSVNPPSQPDITSVTDTGTSTTDNITSNTTPVFTGTAEANSTVKLYDTDGTTLLGTATANGSGNWSITSYALSEGVHTLTATATDAAGNTSAASLTLSVTVDTTAPAVTAASAAFSVDTGTSSTDLVTKTASQTVSGTLSANMVAGEIVEVSLDNGSTWTTATTTVGSNTWSLSGVTLLGSNTLKVRVSDSAGNNGTVYSQAYVLDQATPTQTFSNIAFSADTGNSSSDFVTRTAAQTITATLSSAPTVTDIVYGSLDNGSTWIDITNKVSGTTLTWNGVTLTSSSTLKLKVVDLAGNDGTVASQAYTLDTTAPAVPSATSMTSGTDTGTSNSDAITTNTTPTFTGTAEAGSTVTLYDSDGTTVLGTAVATGGNWSITSSALSAGAHTLTVKATDAAGNTSDASTGLVVTIDTIAPSSIGASTTTISTVGATSTSTVATLSATDTQAITYGLATGNGTNDADNGSFSISGTSLNVGSSALTAGTYKVYVSATDAAGNVSYEALTITVVDAPSVSSVVRTGGATATVATSATSISYTVTFSESVTGVDVNDFTLTAIGTANGAIASVSGTGTTYTVTVNTLSGDGTLRLDLKSSATGIQNGSSVDIASGYTAGSTYTLDRTAPSAPSTPNLDPASDTGTSDTDNITSDTTPVFSGTAEANSTVTLYDSDGTTVLGTATADGAGAWTITSSAMSGGTHNITVKTTDAAGNTSAASAALSITVDATAPSAVILSTTSVADTAATNGTTVATLSATDTTALTYALVAGANDTNNGSFTISGGNLQAAANLAAGTYNIRVQATDAAGNTTEQTFTITVTAGPSVSSINRAAGSALTNATSVDFTVTFNESVTGVDASDFALTTTGTAAGSIASITGSGTTYTVTVNGLSGDGTLRLDLDNNGTGIVNAGTQAITGGYTSGQTYTLDTSSPTAPTGLDMDAGSDSGTSNTDNVTSDNTPTVSGAGAEPGSTVTLYDSDGTTVLGTTTADGAGAWTVTSSALSNGVHTLTAKVTDGAGNTGAASTPLSVTIDTTAPSAPGAIDLDSGSDTGISNSDNVTSDTTPTFNGTAEANSTVTLYDTDGTTVLGTTTADSSGNWSITASTLASGSHTLTVEAKDAAGNESGASSSLSVTIDTTPPNAPTGLDVLASSDSGTSNTDNITSNNTPTVSGAGAEPGSTVTLYDTNGTTVLGTATADSSGNWSVTTSTLPDGTHTLTAKVTDTAGNVGAASSSLTVTIDSTAPGASGTPVLASGSDSGVSNADNITSDTTPTITGGGAEAGATVTLYDTDGTTVLGTATADGSGNWSITSSTLSEGAHTLTTKVTDTAGNTSVASASLAITVDTTAPTAITLSANSVMDVATGTNTAVANLSSTDTQLVSYTLEAGNGTNDAGNASFVIAGGVLQSRSQLTAGTYNIRVGATDAAGNISYQTFVITVNTNTAPTITSGASGTVAENAAISTVVYTATATDVDAGQTLSYSLTGTDAGSFDINPSTGVVTLKASANYEAKASYSFNVVATDNGTGTLTDTKAVTVTVTDVNEAPTGSLTINGTVKQGEILSVQDTLEDDDGMTDKAYQWYADGQLIVGANQNTLTLGQDQVGKVITVKASYTDRNGRVEVSSSGTVQVANTNDPTTGEVSVSGDAGIGQTLTASNTLSDADGMGDVQYQWQYKDANGDWRDITLTDGTLATGNQYTVDPAYALAELRVQASFTDGQGTPEVRYSTANIKAGGLPPTPVITAPVINPVIVVQPLPVADVIPAPVVSFMSVSTVNSIPVLSSGPTVVSTPASLVVDSPAQTPASAVVSLGVTNSAGSSTSGLRAIEASRDVVIERGEQVTFTLPAGTFVHTDGAAQVTLSARLADGRPLPANVKFNPTTGTFTVEAAPGEQAEQLQVVVNAVDDKGQTASTTLVIKLKEKAGNSSALDLPIKLGKLSLGEQIRMAEKPAGHMAELAALSKAFAASQHARSYT